MFSVMSLPEFICGLLLIIFSIVIIFVVILQEGHQANLSGAIAGGADTFFGKNKARSIDAFLAKFTKFFAVGFFILTLVANVFSLIGK